VLSVGRCVSAPCCRVLRCVAACCTVLQVLSVGRSVFPTGCSMLQRVALFRSTSQGVAGFISGQVCFLYVLQCVAACCSVLQCVAVLQVLFMGSRT